MCAFVALPRAGKLPYAFGQAGGTKLLYAFGSKLPYPFGQAGGMKLPIPSDRAGEQGPDDRPGAAARRRERRNDSSVGREHPRDRRARRMLLPLSRMPPERTDEELMIAYLDGDPRAFDVLFARYAPRLHAFFARSFRSRAVADDLLQTTFLKVHAARASWKRDLAVRPWLFGIAARARIDELRRRYRREEQAEDDLDARAFPVDASPDAWPEKNEAAARVRRAIDALPDGQRLVVLLHRFEGLTFGEIAEVVSETEGTKLTEVAVRVRAFRAYDALRAALADLDDSPAREKTR